MNENEAPLIHTSKGNVSVDSLRHEVTWADDAANTTFTESYYDGEELVKRSVHVMSKTGVFGDGQIGKIGE